MLLVSACLFAFAAPFAVQSSGVLDLRAAGWSVPSATAADSNAPALAVPVCSGGNRAERRLTCVVDGDTGWEDGVKWRLTSRSGGVDAPEISRPECSAERAAGDRATRRLQALMAGGYSMKTTGTDRYDRELVVITLADGRDAGEILIAEGLAQSWPNSGNPWCRS
ncbi:thermonuclease family protein [Aureimonas mangrovi]|uniref:thermonuclease family protein n=1 Tax=Aureimonas mangrovi TaxID=2758041 RepID=UPI00163DD6BD|nr:thermonuclease family protein [Aureimonas mangrovi]